MTSTFFITTSDLRGFTDLASNIQNELLTSAIREAQDIEIQRILGTLQYRRLIDGKDAADLTADESTLIDDYIKSALIYWSYYYALDAIFIQPHNAGVKKFGSSEASDGVDVDLYDRKRNGVKNKAEYYSELLATYLISNTSTFPLYLQGNGLDEKIADTNSQYGSPFVLRSKGTNLANRMGLEVTNSRFPFQPPNLN